ncbi:MAG: hypothetical protein LBR53_13520 [Deltaproteobacteria bacterium]|jgi:hypothetical protein|nr:hypothetical protein [Deltaproteobacteria bacterium]
MTVSVSDILPAVDKILAYLRERELYKAQKAVREALERQQNTEWRGRAGQVDELNRHIAKLKAARMAGLATARGLAELCPSSPAEKGSLLRDLERVYNSEIDYLRRIKSELENGNR